MSAIFASTHKTTNTFYTQFLPSIPKNTTFISIPDFDAHEPWHFKRHFFIISTFGHLARHPVIRFQEKVYLIGPLDPVFDKNHESGVIFDGFCDHFCANLEIMSYHAPKWAFNAFSRVFKRKLGLPSRAKLFSCSHCTTFVVTTFSVSATISAQILELCAKIT